MIENIFMLVLQVILGILGFSSIICAILFLFYPIERMVEKIEGPKSRWYSPSQATGMAIALLAMFGWGIFFFNGVKAVLWFLPESWGRYDDYDSWSPVKDSISYFVAFVLVCVVIEVLKGHHRLKEKIQQIESKQTD